MSKSKENTSKKMSSANAVKTIGTIKNLMDKIKQQDNPYKDKRRIKQFNKSVKDCLDLATELESQVNKLNQEQLDNPKPELIDKIRDLTKKALSINTEVSAMKFGDTELDKVPEYIRKESKMKEVEGDLFGYEWVTKENIKKFMDNVTKATKERKDPDNVLRDAGIKVTELWKGYNSALDKDPNGVEKPTADSNALKMKLQYILAIPGWGLVREALPQGDFDKKIQETRDRAKVMKEKLSIVSGSEKDKAIELIKEEHIYRLKCIDKGKPTPGYTNFCFDGPPGVGKTTFCKELAKVCNMAYGKVSMEKMEQSEDVSGRPSFWQGGGSPGAVVLNLFKGKKKDNKTEYPFKGKGTLILYDEIEKGGKKAIRGLGEQLEASSKYVLDSYLEIKVPSTDVLGIGTTNDFEALEGHIKSRFGGKVLKFEGYDLATKLIIARKKWDSIGGKFGIDMSDEVLKYYIDRYEVEPGIRNLESNLGILEKKAVVSNPEVTVITKEFVAQSLGEPEWESKLRTVSSLEEKLSKAKHIKTKLDTCKSLYDILGSLTIPYKKHNSKEKGENSPEAKYKKYNTMLHDLTNKHPELAGTTNIDESQHHTHINKSGGSPKKDAMTGTFDLKRQRNTKLDPNDPGITNKPGTEIKPKAKVDISKLLGENLLGIDPEKEEFLIQLMLKQLMYDSLHRKDVGNASLSAAFSNLDTGVNNKLDSWKNKVANKNDATYRTGKMVKYKERGLSGDGFDAYHKFYEDIINAGYSFEKDEDGEFVLKNKNGDTVYTDSFVNGNWKTEFSGEPDPEVVFFAALRRKHFAQQTGCKTVQILNAGEEYDAYSKVLALSANSMGLKVSYDKDSRRAFNGFDDKYKQLASLNGDELKEYCTGRLNKLKAKPSPQMQR